MNLKEQQYVCTLARCQSLSRAAKELFISPSALSVYISNLEKYLGVRLFERTGRGKAFVLTSIGEEYVVRAEKMLELKAEFDGLVENELHKSHPAIQYAYSVEGDRFLHLDMRHLDRETFIVPMQDQSMRRTANHILEQAHIRPGLIVEIGHFDVIMSMVNQGLGIGFNRLGYIQDMQKFDHVRYFLIDREAYQSSLVLVYRKGHVISDCEQYLMDIMIDILHDKY